MTTVHASTHNTAIEAGTQSGAFDIVRTVLGGVVLLAATAKGYELATAPILGDGIFGSRWFMIAVVELELVLGIWLLSGLFAQALWWIAMLCFSVFAAVALQQALGSYNQLLCSGVMKKGGVHWVSSSTPTAHCGQKVRHHESRYH
jgi:hypothetical protein